MWPRIALALACASLAASASAQSEGPCVPSEPTRLHMDAPPARMRSGDRFCFDPRADDAAGCPVPEPRVRFRVDPPIEGAVGMIGRCFVAPALRDGELRSFRIRAVSGEARRTFTVRVEALVLEPLASEATAAEPLAERPPELVRAEVDPASAAPRRARAELEHATSAAGEDARIPGSLVAAVLVLVGAVPSALLAFWVAGRRTRAERPSPAYDVPLERRSDRPHAAEPALECPRCGQRYRPGTAVFCSRDGERLR